MGKELARAVLEKAVAHRRKPASIMTDHGFKFHANKADAGKRGESEFGKRPAEPDAGQIMARVKRPHTSGKLERIRREIRRNLSEFESILMRTSNPHRPLHEVARLQAATHVTGL